MITNERQYRITKSQIINLTKVVKSFNLENTTNIVGSNNLAKIELEAFKSEIDVLSEQLFNYEALKSGSVNVFKAHSLRELPLLLIQARIAQGLTQRQLASKLKLKEQQIQRYESEVYASANIRRLAEIADVLNVVFNSKTHSSTFLKELPLFLNHLPDFVPKWTIEKIKTKSLVIYPGIEDSVLLKNGEQRDPLNNSIPLIIWNHRWEFDKNPETFFNVLFKLKEENIPFQLALLGEKYKKQPSVFKEAAVRLKENIIHTGYIENYNDYLNILKKGNIVVSTANQENYGIAVIEAILSGCMPLLPGRLSYPELIPPEFHSECLYTNENDLEKKIKRVLKGDKGFKQSVLIDSMSGLCWNSIIKEFDNLFYELIDREK